MLFHYVGLIRNFEESEDELREAVADSMRNLYVMEDSSSDENTQETGEMEDMELGGHADDQQIIPEVAESHEEVSERLLKVSVIKTEEDHWSKTPCEPQKDDDAALNKEQTT